MSSRKSLFEKQREEQDAKKAREKAETAAVLKEFEDSFEDNSARNVFAGAPKGPSAPGKRHFTSTNLKTGPGSLPRSGPGSLGPVQGHGGSRRYYDEYNDRKDQGQDRGSFLSREDSRFKQEDEEKEEKAAKPTLHLSSMPPGTSTSVIQSLFVQTPLTVDSVRLLPSRTSGEERKSCSAIVTLAAETPSADIDTVVGQLQNRYLGFGFKLSLSRHLSSAALIAPNALSTPTSSSLPFGARPIVQQASLSRAPPPGQNKGFAPPVSYTSSTPYTSNRGPASEVIVQPPSDLKLLKLIHKTIESLVNHGPEFEALLMTRHEVQRDQKWSWLWDSSSQAGVYYRWRLWDVLTNNPIRCKPGQARSEILFEGQSAWSLPEDNLRFEYTTTLDEVISDADYNSSDEEADEPGGIARRHNDHASGLVDDNDGIGYLTPLAKAKLTHLLSRLPDSSSKLRRGDVARITAFAIDHASFGGEEVAQLITRNVTYPLRKESSSSDDSGVDTHNPSDSTSLRDTTSAQLVGLYIISDLLSTSASAGVRHAWRYRTLFETQLQQQKVFERLGKAENQYKWGKLKAEKWKRSIRSLLTLWEGWSVFPQASQEAFLKAFSDSAESEEKRTKDAEKDRQKENTTATKWKSVQIGPGEDNLDGVPTADNKKDADGDVQMGLTSDVDEDIDGVSMVDSSDEEMDDTDSVPVPVPLPAPAEAPPLPTQDTDVEDDTSNSKNVITSLSMKSSGPPLRKNRPKAADMFADNSD